MNESDRLEEIFSESLKLRDDEVRRAYVQQACGEDVELAQRVFLLLNAAHEAPRFLEPRVEPPESKPGSDLPVAPAAPISSKSEFPFLAAPTDPDDIGSLGPYRILNCVGRGGMGIVFRGFDLKLQRVVAIKVLAPEIAIDPTARKRFEREARSAAAVSNPHCVVIYAVDEMHNPPYMVMEFIQGKTLADKIGAQGTLSVREILRIGAQIADGLAAAHKQGLVHRDMKPSNVLLENGIERAKVVDFGLAKTIDDGTMTRTGDCSGTPLFMSPEQAGGGVVDHRTDLFSLGSILYTMCTGKPPFRAENALAVLKRISEDKPRPIQRLNPDVPNSLTAIIDRLLAKNPSDRFQSAAEVADLLQKRLAMLQQGASNTRSVWDVKSPFALKLRRNWPWPVLAITLLAGIGILVWIAPSAMQGNAFNLNKTKGDSAEARRIGTHRETGQTQLDSLPHGDATKSSPSLEERNQSPDPFDGMNAGDRRELTELAIVFRWCPPGRFMMGRPKLEVGNNQVETIVPRGFWIQETEVTQSEWVSLMGSLPSHEMNKGLGDRYPIYFVSLDEATKYCRKLTEQERNAGSLPAGWEFRLPTEAQWEYACRAGTTTDTAFGDELSSAQANFGGEHPYNGAPKGPSHNQAVKVGSYRPNGWGIYDMHGNVKEFTTTPGRVRGGSWCDSGRNCCSGIFIPDPPDALDSVGFRIVLVPVP